MMAAHKHINARLSGHDLSPSSYRVSADYVPVDVVKSSTLQTSLEKPVGILLLFFTNTDHGTV
jgi:hypothetical protein